MPTQSDAGFHNQLGGLWIDRLDAPWRIDRMHADGLCTAVDASNLVHFYENGYVILKSAVSAEAVAHLNSDVSSCWRGKYPDLKATVHGYKGSLPVSIEEDFVGRTGVKILDLYAFSDAARKVLLCDPIVRFLYLIFDGRVPVLFQSLTFFRSSEQWVHQDSAYVAVSEPLHMAAAWIALEDIDPESGPLVYYEGSHRIGNYLFQGQWKKWRPERDGYEEHSRWLAWIEQQCRARNLPLRTFVPERGDALIWHADLAHGGSPVKDPLLTRKSIVGHFCPTGSTPEFFDAGAHRVVPCNNVHMISSHFPTFGP
jgi:phytanoyl-CoA hydroxylase